MNFKETDDGRQKVIVICGSTRFVGEMAVMAWVLEKAGFIVMAPRLLPEWYLGEGHHFAEEQGVKDHLDALHNRKIDLADEVYVLTVNAYYGESTAAEITHARNTGKPVTFIDAMSGEDPELWPQRIIEDPRPSAGTGGGRFPH